MRAMFPTLALAALLGCTTTTSQIAPATEPPPNTEANAATAPTTESASRPLPRYCEDRRGAELLVTALVVPCVIKSHPLTQLTQGNQADDFPEARPIGLFERRIDAAMLAVDAAGKEQGFTGILIAQASGAGSFYLKSEDGKTRCSGESNIRQGVGSGSCTDGRRLSYTFEPQGVRSNGHVLGQQAGGQGRIAFGWGNEASVALLRGKLQPSG